ncbi:MAG: hypothetical protein SH847_00775 [Roseiflexaceae bacterium]|nr:hypothetical protein [Roseiflexaceae bacterium]
MSTVIETFVITWIWTRSSLSAIASPMPGIQLAQVGNLNTYEECYEQICLDGSATLGTFELQLPWKNHSSLFWYPYLGIDLQSDFHRQTVIQPTDTDDQRKKKKERVRKHLVPFIASMPWQITATNNQRQPERAVLDVATDIYFYPTGYAFVLTMYGQVVPTSLEGLVNTVHALRHTTQLQMTLYGKHIRGLVKRFGEQVMDRIGQEMLGLNSEIVNQLIDTPLSLITVLDGGVEPQDAVALHTLPVEEDSAIAQALRKLGNVKSSALTGSSQSFSAGKIPMRGDNVGDVIYGEKRSRVIWLPEKFAVRRRRAHRCLHKNMGAALLQTEMLVSVLDQSEKAFKRGQTLSPINQFLEKDALARLKSLYYGKKENTYRSGSVRALIDQNEWLPLINRRNAFWGRDAL